MLKRPGALVMAGVATLSTTHDARKIEEAVRTVAARQPAPAAACPVPNGAKATVSNPPSIQ